jgi:hypothetical protein
MSRLLWFVGTLQFDACALHSSKTTMHFDLLVSYMPLADYFGFEFHNKSSWSGDKGASVVGEQSPPTAHA